MSPIVQNRPNSLFATFTHFFDIITNFYSQLMHKTIYNHTLDQTSLFKTLRGRPGEFQSFTIVRPMLSENWLFLQKQVNE